MYLEIDETVSKMTKVKDISLFIDNAENMPDGRLAMIYIVLKALEKDKLAIVGCGRICDV